MICYSMKKNEKIQWISNETLMMSNDLLFNEKKMKKI